MSSTGPDSQRRNLAILFSDLCESTRISGSLEPEQFAALLERLRELYDIVITRHGGLIVRIDGDGVTCAFGYPQALDDAGRRATEAALDLHAAVAALDQSFAFPGVSIRLHSGIHSGVVLVREGDMVRGRIEILGDTTNVAARLCDHAGPDQIVVSEASLGGDRHFFVADAGAVVSLKGRKAQIPALLVNGRAEVATRFAARSKRGLAPFCGREAELARLRDLLAEARAGSFVQASVVGAAGIGKTRLLSEFLDESANRGITVHRGYCEAYLGARPLQPFEQIAQTLARDEQVAADISARVLGWAGNRKAEPAILAIDDWQWADDASHALLDEIARLEPGGVLILRASRPEGVPGTETGHGDRIELAPLSERESERAITGLLLNSDPFRIQRIRELSGGSPLFIEELCHAQAEQLPGEGASDSSAWLDTLVHARFLELPERKADLVRIASVIGHMVPIGLFAAVTGIGANDPVLDELRASDFLYQGDIEGTLRFKHLLTRDAIYRTVGFDERRRLHGLVAERLEDLASQEGKDEYVDALAYHNASAGRERAALPFAVMAGDAALAAGALDRAQADFRLAFQCHKALGDEAPAEPGLTGLITRYGRACVIDPSVDQLEVLDEMVALARAGDDKATLGLTLYWRGSINFGLGDARSAIQSLTEALECATIAKREGLAAQTRAALGASWFDMGASDTALTLLEQATAAMREELTGNRAPAYLYAISNKAQILADRGDFAGAFELFREVDGITGEAEAPIMSSLMTQRATIHIWHGDYAKAAEFGQMAENKGMLVRSRQNAMFGKALRGYAEFRLSGDGKAARTFEEALVWLDSSSYRHRISLFYGWGAEVMAQLGRPEDCRNWAARALARRRYGDSFGTASAARSLARLAAAGIGNRPAEHYLAVAERADRERQSAWSKIATESCRTEIESAR